MNGEHGHAQVRRHHGQFIDLDHFAADIHSVSPTTLEFFMSEIPL